MSSGKGHRSAGLIEVLTEGWHYVHLRLNDAAIRSATIGDKPARIIFESGKGHWVLLEKKGPEPEKVDHTWVTLFGMPLALSVDNLLAGTGLGLLGFSPVIPAVIFGVATAIMSLVGLLVGRAAARVIPIRSDLLSGVSLLTAAIVLPLVFA